MFMFKTLNLTLPRFNEELIHGVSVHREGHGGGRGLGSVVREADPNPVRFLASCVPGAGLASGSLEGTRRGGRS